MPPLGEPSLLDGNLQARQIYRQTARFSGLTIRSSRDRFAARLMRYRVAQRRAAAQSGLTQVLAAMLKFLALIAILSLSACGHYASRDIQGTCHEIVGLPQGNLLLFGEMHGSVEAPALVENISCSLSKSQPVAVGLEYPSTDQNLIVAYLASGGSTADKEKLLDTYFWKKNIDGRSSTAMLQLIERIRTLKNEGYQIDLFAFDDQPGTELERNMAIANGIRRFHSSHPKVKIVALMGNVHAMQAPMGSGEERMLPSGYLLKDLEPVSILVQYPKGTIWACFSGDCRIHELAPRTVRVIPPQIS